MADKHYRTDDALDLVRDLDTDLLAELRRDFAEH